MPNRVVFLGEIHCDGYARFVFVEAVAGVVQEQGNDVGCPPVGLEPALIVVKDPPGHAVRLQPVGEALLQHTPQTGGNCYWAEVGWLVESFFPGFGTGITFAQFQTAG